MKMKYFKAFLLLLFVHIGFISSAQKSKSGNELKSIDSLTQKMQKKAGLITSYHKEDKIYFELSDCL